MLGSSSWMPYAPQGVKGTDDDYDDDDELLPLLLLLHSFYFYEENMLTLYMLDCMNLTSKLSSAANLCNCSLTNNISCMTCRYPYSMSILCATCPPQTVH
jgi:hypothetical protein